METLSNTMMIVDSTVISLKRLDEGVVEFNNAALSCEVSAIYDATTSCAEPDFIALRRS